MLEPPKRAPVDRPRVTAHYRLKVDGERHIANG